MTKISRAAGKTKVTNLAADNTTRLITEAILRELLFDLWDSGALQIDEEALFNLQDLTGRDYALGECMVYDAGSGFDIYRATTAAAGLPFVIGNWENLTAAAAQNLQSVCETGSTYDLTAGSGIFQLGDIPAAAPNQRSGYLRVRNLSSAAGGINFLTRNTDSAGNTAQFSSFDFPSARTAGNKISIFTYDDTTGKKTRSNFAMDSSDGYAQIGQKNSIAGDTLGIGLTFDKPTETAVGFAYFSRTTTGTYAPQRSRDYSEILRVEGEFYISNSKAFQASETSNLRIETLAQDDTFTKLMAWGTDGIVKWVDKATIASSITVDNGLEDIGGGVIGLGGQLSQSTTIDGNQNQLVFSNNDNFVVQDTHSNLIVTGNGFLNLQEASGSAVNLFLDTVSIFNSLGCNLTLSNTGINITDGVNSTNILTDTGGLSYQSDYSTNFTNRSLVDKEYVDNNAGISSIVAGANITVNNTDPQNPVVSSFPITSAGILSRTYFTGETETLSSGTYYKSNRDGKGTVASVSQAVTVNDNQKAFFAQDVISQPFTVDTNLYSGSYSGVLNGSISGNAAQQRFTVEIYITDSNGTPISSGVTGAPVGDLGVTVLTIADSGLIELQAGNETQISVTAELTETIVLTAGQRVRYHVSAEKVGTQGNPIDITTFYGFDHVAHIDIPIPATTDTVINTDLVEFPTEANQFEINRTLKAQTGTSYTFQFGLNEAAGVVELGGEAAGQSLAFWSDSTFSNQPFSQELIFGINPSLTGQTVFEQDTAFRDFIVVTDLNGTATYQQTGANTNIGTMQATTLVLNRNKGLAANTAEFTALAGTPQIMSLAAVKDSTDLTANRADVYAAAIDNFGNPEAVMRLNSAQSNIGKIRLSQTGAGGKISALFEGLNVNIDTAAQNDANTKILSLNSTTNEVEFVDKSTIGQGASGSKAVAKYEFVKAGQVNTSVTLEPHSSFGNAAPIILPSGIISAKIVGFNMFATTSSINQAGTGTFQVRTQPRSNRTQRAFNGGTLRYTNTQLTSTGAQGVQYYESLDDPNLRASPVSIGVNDMVFVDFAPVFWNLTDVNVHLFIEVEIA